MQAVIFQRAIILGLPQPASQIHRLRKLAHTWRTQADAPTFSPAFLNMGIIWLGQGTWNYKLRFLRKSSKQQPCIIAWACCVERQPCIAAICYHMRSYTCVQCVTACAWHWQVACCYHNLLQDDPPGLLEICHGTAMKHSPHQHTPLNYVSGINFTTSHHATGNHMTQHTC